MAGTTGTLPVEMLSMIFAHSALQNPRREGIPLSVDLSSVSRRWREVALDTPELWTEVSIHIPPWPSVSRLARHLRRSRTRLLDVVLDLTAPGPIINPRTGASVVQLRICMEALLVHRARLRRLTVRFNDESHIRGFLNHFEAGSAPVLQELNLTTRAWFNGGRLPNFLGTVFSGGVPALARLAIVGVPPHCFRFLNPNIVTSLEIANPPEASDWVWQLFAGSLLQFPSLANLTLRGDVCNTRTGGPVPVPIPFLDHLHIEGAALNALRFLDLPALRALVLSDVDDHDFATLVDGLRYNQYTLHLPALSTVTLRRVAVNEVLQLAELAYTLPTVTHLLLQDQTKRQVRRIVETLACIATNANGALTMETWPALETLYCAAMQEHCLVELVQSPRRLRALYMCPGFVRGLELLHPRAAEELARWTHFGEMVCADESDPSVMEENSMSVDDAMAYFVSHGPDPGDNDYSDDDED